MKMKKVLAATLAATMVMATALTASAASTVSSGSGATTDEATPILTYQQAKSQEAGATVKVAGLDVRTTLSGVYAAESIRGIAVRTALDDVKASLGLTGTQKPIILVYDMTTANSPAAMTSINAAAEALGGKLVSSLYIDLGAKQNGKWVTLTDGTVAVQAGLPKGADTSATYSVVYVKAGGETTILEDQDTNPNTVTFPVSAGVGAYGIVAE